MHSLSEWAQGPSKAQRAVGYREWDDKISRNEGTDGAPDRLDQFFVPRLSREVSPRTREHEAMDVGGARAVSRDETDTVPICIRDIEGYDPYNCDGELGFMMMEVENGGRVGITPPSTPNSSSIDVQINRLPRWVNSDDSEMFQDFSRHVKEVF